VHITKEEKEPVLRLFGV